MEFTVLIKSFLKELLRAWSDLIDSINIYKQFLHLGELTTER